MFQVLRCILHRDWTKQKAQQKVFSQAERFWCYFRTRALCSVFWWITTTRHLASNLAVRGVFSSQPRGVRAICFEPKRSVFEMPIAPLQIDHSVVVKSQAIAVNAPLMNLGSHFVILVTSVTLARLFYGSFQHVGHLRKFLPTVPKAKAKYTSFSWNLDLPKAEGAPRLFQECLRHYEEEDSRQLYVVMSKTHCHL